MIALVGSERIGALLRKEKDEASRPNCFWLDSLNAFIPRFAKSGGFLFSKIFRLRAGLSIAKPFREFFHGTKLKDQKMKKVRVVAGVGRLCSRPQIVHAISLNDIQLWTGSGTNRAALVIEWNSPEVFNQHHSSRPDREQNDGVGLSVQRHGHRHADVQCHPGVRPALYAVESIDPTYGTLVEGIGYNLNGNGISGVTDGTVTYTASSFTNGVLIESQSECGCHSPFNSGDLFWSGYYGPNWQALE